MKMAIDKKFASLGALILLAGLGVGYTLNRMPENAYINPDVTLTVDEQCALNTADCIVELSNDSAISFNIAPRPIKGVSPLVFSLNVDNLEIKQAVIDLTGVDMNMGSYRFAFESQGNNLYTANGNLPVCIRNQMLWQADIWLDTKQQGLVKVPYIFSAQKP